MLYIITPCRRPKNLTRIRESLSCFKDLTWWIIHDTNWPTNVERPVFPGVPNILELFMPGGIYGNHQRNVALDMGIASSCETDWVYFLDDDNLMHPLFMDKFNDLKNKFPTYRGFLFAQDLDGTYVRKIIPDRVKRNWVDMGQFVIQTGLIGSTRFEQAYEADGIFIETIFEKYKSEFVITGEVMSYYKFLTR